MENHNSNSNSNLIHMVLDDLYAKLKPATPAAYQSLPKEVQEIIQREVLKAYTDMFQEHFKIFLQNVDTNDSPMTLQCLSQLADVSAVKTIESTKIIEVMVALALNKIEEHRQETGGCDFHHEKGCKGDKNRKQPTEGEQSLMSAMALIEILKSITGEGNNSAKKSH